MEESKGPARPGWTALAVVLFLLADLTLFQAAIGNDPTRFIAVGRPASPARLEPWNVEATIRSDQHFVGWVVARNARTWLRAPWRLFEAETCYPADRALSLGEPALTVGLLGTPAWLLSGDPLMTLNFVVWLLPWIGALAMYWLVRDWTASPAAGIIAGLLYGFHAVKTVDPLHVYIYDTTWTLLALGFARRWLQTGRWRDALGLASAVAMQIGGSLYPLIASGLVAGPLFGWMVVRHGIQRTDWSQWAVVASVCLLAAYGAFEPFISLRSGGGLGARPVQFFAPWFFMGPGGPLFAGWVVWLLVGAALAGSFDRTRGTVADPSRDPVLPWLLFGYSLAVLWLATGGNAGDRFWAELHGRTPANAWFDPYALLARLVPGLDAVRGPMRIQTGAHWLLCLLAGLGAAAGLRRVPRRWTRPVVAIGIVLVFAETVRPTWLFLPPRIEISVADIRPASATIELYRQIASEGPGGPIFEAPFRKTQALFSSETVLLAAYHHERTSACAASFQSAEYPRMLEISTRLPAPDAVEELAELGFESVVLRHPGGVRQSPYASRVVRALAAQTRPTLEIVGATTDQTAYAIRGAAHDEPSS